MAKEIRNTKSGEPYHACHSCKCGNTQKLTFEQDLTLKGKSNYPKPQNEAYKSILSEVRNLRGRVDYLITIWKQANPGAYEVHSDHRQSEHGEDVQLKYVPF